MAPLPVSRADAGREGPVRGRRVPAGGCGVPFPLRQRRFRVDLRLCPGRRCRACRCCRCTRRPCGHARCRARHHARAGVAVALPQSLPAAQEWAAGGCPWPAHRPPERGLRWAVGQAVIALLDAAAWCLEHRASRAVLTGLPDGEALHREPIGGGGGEVAAAAGFKAANDAPGREAGGAVRAQRQSVLCDDLLAQRRRLRRAAAPLPWPPGMPKHGS